MNYRNGLHKGAKVAIVRDDYGQADRGISLIGRTGRIRRGRTTRNDGWLCWDVELDAPLRDGRKFLWCSTRELVLA